MVEFTTEPIAGRQRLARTCRKCGQAKWRCEYENLWVKRCIDCKTKLLKQAKCRNCGQPTRLCRNKLPIKYCAKPECQEARRLYAGAAAGRARAKRFSKATSRRCKVCDKLKPLTLEHFTIGERHPDGSIRYFYTYCRECENADKRARNASDPDRRAKNRARVRAHKARQRERRRQDPEYDAQYRARRKEQNRQYRQRRKERQEGPQAQQPPAPNSGAEMPAAPLMVFIDAWMEREGIDAEMAAARLGTSPRRFWDWRQPGAKTRLSIADSCLLGLEANWFEIWPVEEYPEVAMIWDPEEYGAVARATASARDAA